MLDDVLSSHRPQDGAEDAVLRGPYVDYLGDGRYETERQDPAGCEVSALFSPGRM
ncbi:hypothetical protein [Actinophytocola sp.]|uniref:hypothetical protein n=1 Tax=Actinophytocola sp. TaxID=1872138 RepID=UPI003D6C4B59